MKKNFVLFPIYLFICCISTSSFATIVTCPSVRCYRDVQTQKIQCKLEQGDPNSQYFHQPIVPSLPEIQELQEGTYPADNANGPRPYEKGMTPSYCAAILGDYIQVAYYAKNAALLPDDSKGSSWDDRGYCKILGNPRNCPFRMQ